MKQQVLAQKRAKGRYFWIQVTTTPKSETFYFRNKQTVLKEQRTIGLKQLVKLKINGLERAQIVHRHSPSSVITQNPPQGKYVY